jgi:hypothetical protein
VCATTHTPGTVPAEALRQHASRADLPIDEVVPVVDTVLVRPDPEPATA